MSKSAQMAKQKQYGFPFREAIKRIFRKQNIFYLESGGCRGKLGRPRCRPRWDTHLNSGSLLNWNSSLAATAAGSVKKCTNGQTKVIWLPFSGSHKKKKRIFRKQNIFYLESGGLPGKVRATKV